MLFHTFNLSLHKKNILHTFSNFYRGFTNTIVIVTKRYSQKYVRKWFIKSTSIQLQLVESFYKLPNDFREATQRQNSAIPIELALPFNYFLPPTIGQMKWSSCRTDGITTFRVLESYFVGQRQRFTEMNDSPPDSTTFFRGWKRDEGGIPWKRTPRRRTMPRVKIEGTGHVFVDEEIPFEKKQLSVLRLRRDKAIRSQAANFFSSSFTIPDRALISKVDLTITISHAASPLKWTTQIFNRLPKHYFFLLLLLLLLLENITLLECVSCVRRFKYPSTL